MRTFKVPAEKTEDGYSFSFNLMTPEEMELENFLLRNQIESRNIKMDALAEQIENLRIKQDEADRDSRSVRLDAAKKRVHETLRSRK